MSEKTLKCWKCAGENPTAARFCSECGASLFLLCTNCQFQNPPLAKFCNECGSYLGPSLAGGEKSVSHSVGLAERRQLTVMFCDLVGSTAMAEMLDVEDLREVLEAYQEACISAIRQYDGYVAKRLGDGLVVLFGYPQAHEDDAQRAIYAGLGVIDEISVLSQRIQEQRGIAMKVRLGIHTGLVVAGEMGTIDQREIDVVGETPSIAARLQELAEPGMIAISAATHRLVSSSFDFLPLGFRSLKGLSRQIEVFRVLAPRTYNVPQEHAHHRLEIVGRDDELALLKEKWADTEKGRSQMILVSGDPGIGKSRLTEAFKTHVKGRPDVLVHEIFCSPYHQGTPFYAASSRLIHEVVGVRTDDSSEERMTKLKKVIDHHGLEMAETLPLLAALFAIPLGDEVAPSRLSSEAQRLRTLDALVRIYAGRPSDPNVLLIVENAQWADPSTLELIGRIADEKMAASSAMLVTYRPTFEPPWLARPNVTVIDLDRLDNQQVERMVHLIAGGRKLPDEVLKQIVHKTDGVPLFVEELTKMILESGLLADTGPDYELSGPIPDLAIPTTLHDSLMARLDRLSTVKEIAQLAAVIGRAFSFGLLIAVSGIDALTLRRELHRLVEAELIQEFRNERGELAYRFRHALIQDAAYKSLLNNRRQVYHRVIAQAIVSQFPETADTQPEILAAHYTAAGLKEPATAYWIQAGQRALARSANLEAIANYKKALDILERMPKTPDRSARELMVHASMGMALIATKGFAAKEVGLCFARAEKLCKNLGHSPQLFPVLWGLWVFALVRGELSLATERAEGLLQLGEQTGTSGLLVEGHFTLGDTLFWRGDLTRSREHLEAVQTLYDFNEHASHIAIYGQDPGVSSLLYLSFALWGLGYTDQALARSKEARQLAIRRAHPFTTGWALGCSALLNMFRGDVEETLRHAQSTIAYTAEQGHPFWLSAATLMQGWAKFRLGDRVEGLQEMRQGLEFYQMTGSEVVQPYFMGAIADCLREVGEFEEGLKMVEGALAKAAVHGEKISEIDLHRIRALLLLARSPSSKPIAVKSLQKSVALARECGARSRLLTSLPLLADLTGDLKVLEELRSVLYGFDEGFQDPAYLLAKAVAPIGQGSVL